MLGNRRHIPKPVREHKFACPTLACDLALLDAFLSDKADQERHSNKLATAQVAARIADLALDNEHCHDGT